LPEKNNYLRKWGSKSGLKLLGENNINATRQSVGDVSFSRGEKIPKAQTWSETPYPKTGFLGTQGGGGRGCGGVNPPSVEGRGGDLNG